MLIAPLSTRAQLAALLLALPLLMAPQDMVASSQTRMAGPVRRASNFQPGDSRMLSDRRSTGRQVALNAAGGLALAIGLAVLEAGADFHHRRRPPGQAVPAGCGVRLDAARTALQRRGVAWGGAPP